MRAASRTHSEAYVRGRAGGGRIGLRRVEVLGGLVDWPRTSSTTKSNHAPSSNSRTSADWPTLSDAAGRGGEDGGGHVVSASLLSGEAALASSVSMDSSRGAGSTADPFRPWHMNFSADEAVLSSRKLPRRTRHCAVFGVDPTPVD